MQPIATVREASLEDYEDSMKACADARRMWMLVMHLICLYCSVFLCRGWEDQFVMGVFSWVI